MTDLRATLAPARTVEMLFAAWLRVIALLLAVMLVVAPVDPKNSITDIFIYRQDGPAIALGLVFWLIAAAWSLGPAVPWPAAPGPGRAGMVALLVAVAALVGGRVVYRNYGLSMDEFMAGFDARIFATGRLLAPVAPEWRPFVDGLQPIFRLPVSQGAAWASAYLPVNAAFLSLFAAPGFPWAASALWAGVSILAIHGLARRMWPGRRDAAWVAALLLASSTQLLVTAMTPYAMSAHLALNLVWLWLFLRGGRGGHLAAAGVAGLACGLHQLIFHPLFAAPFVLQLWLARRWRVAAFHTAAYALIGLFWTFYAGLALRLSGVEPAGTVGAAHLAQQVAGLLSTFDLTGVALMAKNLLRFIAWQNPLAIALFVLGFGAALRRGGVLQALAAGFLLTLAAVFVLLPFQGHGWGYRYVHGLLGSVCLIAVGAWITLTEADPTRRPVLAKALAAACVFVWGLLLPWQALQVHRWVTPYARASDALAAIDADVVIIDPRGIWYGRDLARNDPFLVARPKIVSLADLDETGVTQLCRTHRVKVFDAGAALKLGLRPARASAELDETAARLRAVMRRLHCGEPPLASARPAT